MANSPAAFSQALPSYEIATGAMLVNIPLTGTALVKTQTLELRTSMTAPLGISVDPDSASGQEVRVEVVGIEDGETVGESVSPEVMNSVAPGVGDGVGAMVE